MAELTIAAVAENFDRDLEACLRRIEGLVEAARSRRVQLLALPEAALGGYLADLGGSQPPPPAFTLDDPTIRRIVELAGDMVVTFGFCEAAGAAHYNSAAAVCGDGVLAVHRKVHQPLREDATYARGENFAAFDTPIGRMGMMICYDKAFPESARTLALDGAEIIVCMSAWPAASTNPAPRVEDDRWKHRFDIFDQARALENQVVWVSANQAGEFGRLRFVGNAKIVDPGGEVLAETGVEAGTAVATIDVTEAVTAARRAMGHLRDRRPEAYSLPVERPVVWA
ncbi:MAG TPA: carbon-nitrogen hydrolase family protein [Sporichthyaceae bacterium]|nr:carbon-nitrogen hydrolase family protein [Sporichthyaceae bacterium]